MKRDFLNYLIAELETLKIRGLLKDEHIIHSPQQAVIRVANGKSTELLNFCSNNYLGLANHSELISAAQLALDEYGYGMSSVRFICGTQSIHKKLETKLSHFLGMEETLLYSSCFDANGGLFEALLSSEDIVISDALNHASIIDGIRLSKAKRLVYDHQNMQHLEEQLKASKNARFRLIATDGVFSMRGTIANLPAICDLADQYDALVMVDDSHAVGLMGESGRGTHEYHHVMDRIDILTGTLGKALGGASGGYTSGKKEIIDWLRQRSRPYLFSNTLAPMIVATSIKVLDLLESNQSLVDKLRNNTYYFRHGLEDLGFNLVQGEHAIIPILLGDENLAKTMAAGLFKEGIYVIGFSYPVVPVGQALIRTQMSAGHEPSHLDLALKAFEKIGKQLGVI